MGIQGDGIRVLLVDQQTVQLHRDLGEGVGQGQHAAGAAHGHGGEEVVDGAGHHGEVGLILDGKEDALHVAGGAVLHAHDVGVVGAAPDQLGTQAHAAGILGRVVDQAGNGHGVGHIGEVAQQHVVGHLLFEIAGGQQRQEICAALAHLAAHLNGLHGGLEDAAGHDGLACALVLHDGLQHAELLGVGQALVFAVGAQGQIALEAGSGIAFHVLGEALVVHAAIGGKGRGDGGENAHQLLFHR